MPRHFTCREQIKPAGAPAAPVPWGTDHALAGQNLFRIHVREKGPAIKQ